MSTILTYASFNSFPLIKRFIRLHVCSLHRYTKITKNRDGSFRNNNCTFITFHFYFQLALKKGLKKFQCWYAPENFVKYFVDQLNIFQHIFSDFYSISKKCWPISFFKNIFTWIYIFYQIQSKQDSFKSYFFWCRFRWYSTSLSFTGTTKKGMDPHYNFVLSNQK